MKYVKLLIILCALLLATYFAFGLPGGENVSPKESATPEERATTPPTNPVDPLPPQILFSQLEGSSVTFTGKKGNLNYEGSFADFQLQLVLDSEAPEDFTKAIAGFAVPIHRLVTGDPEFTSYLLSEEFFDANAYPMATFFSTNIEHVEGTSHIVTGDLTVHGVTRSISFPAEITNEYVSARYVLNRSDFNLGGPEAFDEEVPVEVEILFNQEEVESS